MPLEAGRVDPLQPHARLADREGPQGHGRQEEEHADDDVHEPQLHLAERDLGDGEHEDADRVHEQALVGRGPHPDEGHDRGDEGDHDRGVADRPVGAHPGAPDEKEPEDGLQHPQKGGEDGGDLEQDQGGVGRHTSQCPRCGTCHRPPQRRTLTCWIWVNPSSMPSRENSRPWPLDFIPP
ncbi:hypothetical protein [Ornithinimicrobium kibberense]|uniref:hypothetical protein n=1 Tax=Ornithinimicrobium kibberense TaxID=282060 RepID=UPI00360E56E7